MFGKFTEKVFQEKKPSKRVNFYILDPVPQNRHRWTMNYFQGALKTSGERELAKWTLPLNAGKDALLLVNKAKGKERKEIGGAGNCLLKTHRHLAKHEVKYRCTAGPGFAEG